MTNFSVDPLLGERTFGQQYNRYTEARMSLLAFLERVEADPLPEPSNPEAPSPISIVKAMLLENEINGLNFLKAGLSRHSEDQAQSTFYSPDSPDDSAAETTVAAVEHG